MANARIATSLEVPADQVDDLLARSGRHGIIIDRPARGRDGEPNDAYSKIKLPLEWTMTDALAKLDSLPPNLKKAARGIVPNAKGYALRVVKGAEVDITPYVAPEVAAQMGPALGLQTSSSWAVRGIPMRATKEGIIKALYAASARWRGWTVKPIRTLTQPRHGKVDWLVEAAVDPPARALTIKSRDSPNGDCLMIERFVEERKVTSRTAAWFRPRQAPPSPPPPKIGALWADITEEEDEEAEHFDMQPPHDQNEEATEDPSNVGQVFPMAMATKPAGAAAAAEPTPSADQGNNHDAMQNAKKSEALTRRMRAAGFHPYSTTARPLQPQGNGPLSSPQPHHPQDQDSEIKDMLRAMQQSMQQKDTLIMQMQETINNLNAQIAAMTTALTALQHGATSSAVHPPAAKASDLGEAPPADW